MAAAGFHARLFCGEARCAEGGARPFQGRRIRWVVAVFNVAQAFRPEIFRGVARSGFDLEARLGAGAERPHP
jgi:hypothetical protein